MNINTKDVVNIVMIADENFIIPTYVSILSMLDCSNSSRTYNVYVLCNDVSSDNKQLLCNISKDLFKVECIDVSPEWLFEIEAIPNIPATKSSLLKFCIPDVFPDLDKVLYIDGDTLIRKDIAGLFDIDITNKMAAVVRDVNLLHQRFIKDKFQLRRTETYFNSGVMLLNLNEFRDKEVSKQLIEYRMNNENHLMDQDAFNAVLRQYPMLYLDVYYNFMIRAITSVSLEKYKQYYKTDIELDADSILDRIVVVHFASFKPWNYYDLLFSDLWLKYYKKTPFSNFELCRTSFYYENVYSKLFYKLFKFLAKKIKFLNKSIS